MGTAYQLSNLKFFYDKAQALSIDKLDIEAKKITALIGPNGCGKSTLLNLLAFLQKNQQGQIKFFSTTVSNQNISILNKRISFLPQKPYMLTGTVVDNLNLTLKFHNIKKKCRLEKIQSTLDKLQIDHLKNQQAKTLSGGEQQKVALARAIITNPDVLLMDEPFSYLDHTSEQLVENFIKHFVKKDNKTLIFSTHNRLQGVALADDVISLIKGELVKSPLLNVYHGSSNHQLFNTGKIIIILADNQQIFQHVSIDPGEIVLSREPLVSSMRNQYQGKVMAITDESGKIRITVLAGEIFQVLITYQALQELNISLGEQIWINFKSNSILAY